MEYLRMSLRFLTTLKEKRRQTMQDQKIPLDHLVNELFSNAPELITRKRLSEITGGAISVKYLANLDSEGIGIQQRIRVGGKVVYPRTAAIEFYKSRCKSF